MRSMPMHLVQWHSILVFLFSTLATVTGKPGFLLTTHNAVIPGSKHKVCITFAGVTSDVFVKYELKRPQDSSYSNIYAATETQWSAAGGCSEFALPVTLPPGSLELSVRGFSIDDGPDSYEFNGKTTLTVFHRVPDFTIIQTDKPVYKPGQTVRIRLVTLLLNLSMVSTGGINVSIKNPDGIDIERWINVSRSKGIVELSLKLADKPHLGTYAILCDVGGRTERKNFTVAQYVLPRVEVLHKAAEFFVIDSPFLTGEVCARYTFSGGMNLPALKGWMEARFSVVKTGNESSVTELPNRVFTLKNEINGCYIYNVSIQQLKIDWSASNIADNYSILVIINVTEHGTGLKTKANDALIKLVTYTAVIRIIGDDTYKPGLPYNFKVKVMFIDRQSHSNKSVRASVFNDLERINLPEKRTDEDGFAFFEAAPLSLFQELTIQAIYKDADMQAQVVAKKKITSWYSPSGRYIKIQPPNNGHALRCNREETIRFDYTTTREGEAVSLHWQVIGKTNIVLSKTEDISLVPSRNISSIPHQIVAESCSMDANVSITSRGYRGWGMISLKADPEMYPTATLIAFYIASDGEIVADWTVIRIKECTRNMVSLSFDKKIVRPGKNLSLTISAAPESYCTYGATDQSIDLISNSKLLDLAEVVEIAQARIPVNDNWQLKLGDYMKYNHQCEQQQLGRNKKAMIPLSVNDSRIAFLMSKMAIVTDAQVDTRKCFCTFNSVSLRGGPLNSAPEPDGELGSDGRTYEPVVRIRDYFPETWLWDGVSISLSGNAAISVTSPHSLTSWRGKAMCVHKDHGFGISPVVSLTTFQRFFIRVRLPFSVIRGESVPVVLKIHNYYPDCFTISVFIENSNQFEIRHGTAVRCICGANPEILVFRIVPRRLGYLNVTITARDVNLETETNACPSTAQMSEIAGLQDTVIESLLVEPEGKKEEQVQTAYICGGAGGQPKNLTLAFALPNDIVADSASGSISVVGDLLAVTLSNMKNLIVLPQGCGEQSMSKFAPITFAARYLQETGQLTTSIEDQVRKFLKEGYQIQVDYMNKRDGSFGYFSYFFIRRPSLWLTAFIVKCFTHASRYLTVASDTIGLSIQYIRQNQSPDGCFSPAEAGVYANFAPALNGSVGEKLKIRVTAFVVIAMLEADVSKNDVTVQKALSCLNSRDETDVYGMAMVAYAFSLHNLQSPQRRNAMTALLGNARSNGSFIYGTTGSTKHWIGDPSQDENAPINIETTAYALLATLVEPGKTYEAMPIANWLTRRQNSRGSYASTQDTVVSIQALAAYARETYSTIDRTGIVVHASMFDFTRTFEVKDFNRLVVQSSELSTLRSGNLTLSINGGGCVVVQAKAMYNVMLERTQSAYFQTLVKPYYKEVTQNSDNCTQRLIQICTKYTGTEDNTSKMTIIDVKMISGWTPDLASLNAFVTNETLQLMTHESKNELLSLHFREITKEFRCLTFEVTRIHNVRSAKPGQVFTYEYYAPGHRSETTFTLDECDEDDVPGESTETLSVCHNEGPECPALDDDTCPSCSQPRPLLKLCQSKHVLKVRLGPGSTSIEDALIVEDFKNKTSPLKNRQAKLVKPQSCLCETLEEDNNIPFVVAYTKDISIRRSRKVSIDLSDSENYVFTCTNEMEQKVTEALKRCPPLQ